jgi:DDE superfamily endonuclease
MNLQSFNKLVSVLEIPINHRQSLRSTSGNLPIEDHIYVSAGLRFLAGSMTADIATIYGMSEQSTDRIIDVFLDKVLACEALHIKIPTADDLQRVANGFNRVSTAMGIFKGVVGAIDGWLVTINKPKESEVDNVGDYFSGHYQCYGLNVLAMCDSRLCFTYMSIAGTGRTNDNRAIQRLERLQKWMDDLPNGYYLIGDNAFTLSNKMLIPFSGAQRNEEHKRTYNFYLSQLRIRIEMAFGRMTTKWRIFSPARLKGSYYE